mgnify:CR=1 FL=1
MLFRSYLGADNRFYIAEATLKMITRMDDISGSNKRISQYTGFKSPEGVAATSNGTLFVTDAGTHQLIKMSSIDDTNPSVVGGRGDRAWQFNAPRGIVLASDGNLYIADMGNRRAVRVNQGLSQWDALKNKWTPFGVAFR